MCLGKQTLQKGEGRKRIKKGHLYDGALLLDNHICKAIRVGYQVSIMLPQYPQTIFDVDRAGSSLIGE